MEVFELDLSCPGVRFQKQVLEATDFVVGDSENLAHSSWNPIPLSVPTDPISKRACFTKLNWLLLI